ncbi:MAG: glycosyltransferase family 4 protein [bacterium]
MKILFLHNYFSVKSGSNTVMFREADILRKNGHEVFFFTTDKQPFWEENYKYAKYFPQYTDYKTLPKLQLLKNIFKPFYNFEAEHKLTLFLEKIKPDIVHCHTFFFHLTPSVLRACYKKNIPVTMTVHGAGFMCPAQGLMLNKDTYCKKELCIKGDYFHCLLNKCLGKSFPANFQPVALYSFYKFLKLYDKIALFICVSQAAADLALRSGIKKEKLALINNFIDDSLLDIQPKYGNKGYFLYVGRLDKEKGLNYLLDAMKRLPNTKLHIAGTGDEEKNLKKQAEELNLSNIKFLGFKSGKELEQEYRNCIATILPCNWFEAFGLTIIESFAYGKPVIASNMGGIPEIIENQKNGLIFEAGNIDELANAIEKFCFNNDLVVEIGKKGRIKAETLYNPQSHYNRLIETYRNIISGANFLCHREERNAVKRRGDP